MYNFNSGYGQALLHGVATVCPTFGKILVVCPSTDSNYDRLSQIIKSDPDGMVRLYATLESAYAAATSNQNDVIVLAAYGVHTLAAPIAWTKSRVHLIGLDGGSRLTDQGSKVQCATAGAVSYVIQVTGTRNHFQNLKFIQASTVATALSVIEMGGEGNVYENVSAIFGVANNLSGTTASEVICGEDSGTFIKCEFGADTLLTSGARAVFLIKKVTAGQEFKSNRFKDCLFKISSSEAGAYLLKVNSTDDVLFSNFLDNCNFLASVDSAGGVALTNAVTSASGLAKGVLAFKNPGSFNCTNFSANNSTHFTVAAPAASNNAFEAVVPA